MASRSARSPRNRQVEDFEAEAGFGAFIGRHRFAVGGVTAFAVAFAYVASNAIWYQPHAHASTFFATRPLNTDNGPVAPGSQVVTPASEVETVIRIEREQSAEQPRAPVAEAARSAAPIASQPQPEQAPVRRDVAGDPVIADVQRILKDLKLYAGEVDGLTGPQTRAAIERYRKMVGLSASAEIDDQLLTQLGATRRDVVGAPPLPQGSPGTDLIETSSAGPRGDAMVMRIQAGLKAFGNDGIEVDGVVGTRTKSAILEFQSLFGLPETGEPDQALLTKMRDIGLTN